MHPARGLKAWEAADLLADEVREAVGHLPSRRNYGLITQLVRSADAISANISEGSERRTTGEKLRCFNIGLCEANETLNHLKRAKRARIIGVRKYLHLANRTAVTHSLLSALIRSMEP